MTTCQHLGELYTPSFIYALKMAKINIKSLVFLCFCAIVYYIQRRMSVMRKFPTIYILKLLVANTGKLVHRSILKEISKEVTILLPHVWIDLSQSAIAEDLRYTSEFIETSEGYLYTGSTDIEEEAITDKFRLWFNNHPHYILLLQMISSTIFCNTRKERINVGPISKCRRT